MPYRRYALHMKRAATCRACGRTVRVRAYYLALGLGLAVGVVLVVLSLSYGDLGLAPTLLFLGGLAVVTLAVDYSLWRWIGFDVAPAAADDADVAPPVSPSSSR